MSNSIYMGGMSSYYNSFIQSTQSQRSSGTRATENQSGTTETKNNFPFSTQKCTQFFTKCVCGGWVVLLIYQVLLIFSTIKDWVQQYWWIIGTVLLIFILILLAIGFFSKLRENLTETHKNLTKIRTSNSKRLNSELQGICDFEE